MELKDIIQIISITISFIVGLSGLVIGIINSRKTIYINSVTTLRTKWLNEMKDYISEFCGLTYNYGISNLPRNSHSELVEKIDKLRYLIKLNLNPKDEFDKLIIEKIDLIPTLTNRKNFGELTKELDELTFLSQKMVKLEWEGIKAEAKSGILKESEKEKLRKKYLN